MKNKIWTKKIISIIMVAVFIIVLSIPIYGSTVMDNNYKKDINQFIEKLNNEVPKLLKKYHIQGASISLIDNGDIVNTQVFGYSDKSKGMKVTEDTLFQVASISKAVTAMGVMKLVEDGTLELDAPVEKYLTRWSLPDTEYNKEDITIRRLLTHTAGLSVHGYAGYSPNEKNLDIVDSLSGKLDKQYKPEIIAEPGTDVIYSGGGFSILQLVIEEVTGKPFEEYMKEAILNKLNMSNSYYGYSEDVLGKVSKAYGVFGQEMPSYVFAENAAAGLLTTSTDLARLCTYLINGSQNPLFSSETVDSILEQNKLKDGSTISRGLGLSVYYMEDNKKAVFHGGDNRGWRADMVFLPESAEGIVTVTNSYLGSYLITEVSALWDEYRLGTKPPYYFSLKSKERLMTIISLSVLILLLIYLFKVLMDLKKGKRHFVFSKESKKRSSSIVKLSVLVILLSVWWFAFYAPWYEGGWTISAFLPIGFEFVTKMVTSCIGVLIAISLLPKIQIKKIAK